MASRTYTGTLFYPTNLGEATVVLYVTESNKYDCKGRHGEFEKIECTGLKSWTIVEGGEEAREYEKFFDEKDENDEYLVLMFDDGCTMIHRNSHVTMFIH